MTDAKARLLQMIADEPHMGGGGLLKAVGKAQKVAKATKEAETAAMRLYHGSPHVMLPTPENKLGKFDPTKMGTGEGGHMYGRGHYLAQSRDVAKNYRPRSPKYEDKLLQEYKKAQKANNYPKMEVLEDAMLHKDPDEILGKYSNAEDGYTPEHTKAAADYIKWYESNRPEVGGVYHVDLPQDYLANMLDYDKPINQHPAQVKALLEKAGINTDTSATAGSMIGGQEAHLAKHGIPGLHYDDTTGAGTRNFVVFPGNEDMLNIVQRDKKGGAVHMAGGGKPKPTAEELAAMRAKQFNVKEQIMLGNPNQFNKDRANQLYPKKETMNPIVKAAKDKLDQFNAFIDRGVPVKELVGGLTGAIPFVGPKLREDLEGATVDFPLGFERLPGNEQVATGNIETAPAKVSDILDSLKMSDLTGGTGASSVLNSVGKGYMPDPLDLLDAASAAALGYGAVKAGAKGAKAAKQGALSAAKAAERFAEKKVPEVMERGGMGAQMLGAFGQNTQSNVVKDTGGNWRGGSVEKQLEGLRKKTVNNADPAEYLATLEQKYGKEGTEEVLASGMHPMIKENAALNKWIDSNLGNYVKKQMATPDDPVRKLAEQGITHKPSVLDDYQDALAPMEDRVKAGFPAEGLGQSRLARRWENASDDAITLHNAGEIQSAPQRAERINAAQQKLAQELDTLNQKFESRIRNSGLKENEIQVLMRTMTPTEKADTIGDDSFIRANVDYLSQSDPVAAFQAKIMEDNPWISKLDPNSSVYSPHLGDLGFDHIVDVLNEDLAAGRIRPEQLNKISMEQAVRRTYEYDQELAAKMNAARASAREGLPVYKEYPEGFRWMELNKPGAFASESEAMGHSVRGYEPPKGHPDWVEGSKDSGSFGYGHGGWEAIKSGRAKVYSLVDKEGQPHVTVEVRSGRDKTGLITSNELPPEVLADIKQRNVYDPRFMYRYDEQMGRYLPEMGPFEPSITQIKGKQNRAPKEDYLPFVQDFVKSGKFSDVGDLQNAGLYSAKDVHNFMPENFTMSKNARTLAIGRARAAGDMPEYMTKPEYEAMLLKHAPEDIWAAEKKKNADEADELLRQLQPPEPGMAAGGAVSDAKQRLLNMIAEEPHMAGGGVLKAIGKAQKTAKKAKMYSAVDKALEASKRGAGTGMEFANELAKTSGIKKAELVDRGIMVPSKNGPVLNPALTQLPKMTKQDFVSHLNEKYKPPGVRKITLGSVKFDQLSDQDLYKEYVRIRGSEPEAYGEPMSREDILDELSGAPDEDTTKAKYSQYKLPGGENYRENLYQYENPTGKAFLQSHFDEPNVMYHMRQTDRIEPTYTSAQIDEIGQRMADAMGTKVENLASGAPILMMRKGVISPVEAAQFAHAKGFQNMDIDMSPAQKRALHIEEIQSDWHQKGRKGGYANETAYQEVRQKADDVARAAGYQDAFHAAEGWKIHGIESAKEASDMLDEASKFKSVNSVPDAPFKNNWYELALKQALMDAAEGDYNQLLITPGAEQAKRYDLSKQISKVRYFDEPNSDSGLLHAYDLEGNNVLSERIPKEKLPDYIGKDAAEKLLSQTAKENERTGFPSQERTLSGLDLQVGGEGMAGFYDKMVPNYLNDIGKKYGVRVGERAIEGDVPYSKTTPTLADVQRLAQEMYGVSDIQAISALPLEQRNAINQAFADKVRAEHTTKLHSFDITPEMREDILNNGLPMYQRGGEVHMAGGGLRTAITKAQKVAKAAKAAKVDHPLVFPRAAAKTLEDIRPIAQRMAGQMTGEFVKQNPKVTTNPAGKSRKQFERERSIPLETRNVVPERPAPDVNYEDYKGYGLVGVPGDPTMGGVAKRGSLEQLTQPTVELTRVGDITPDYPVPLFGGPRYGDEDKFWASNLGAAVPIQKNASKLAEEYQSPVLAKYIKMGSGSENFALHNLDALLSIQRPEKLDKAKMAQLTEAIQAGSPKYGKFPGFTGFKDPADVLLQAQMDSNLRKHIAETLTKPTITDQLGLPNGLDVVAAITYPELRNLETGASGFSVGKMKPGATLQRGQSSHPSYDTDIPGSFLGRSRYPTPYEIAFPDTTAYARSKMTPGVQEFNMMKMLGPRERIDQQYIDEIKMYEQLMKQYTGKKKGGLAHSKKVKRHGNTVSN